MEDTTPEISTLGFPGALVQDLGYEPDNSVESYIVSGNALTGDITITPPANFEVSLNETDWFTNASPLLLSPASGTVEDATIFVRLNATEVGEFSGDISHTSPGAEEETVSLSGTTVDLVPEITLTESLEEFVQNLSTPSASQNYRVSGVNLKEDVTVAAPTDFEVSIDEVTWGASVNVVATDRTITNAQVFVRLAASALGDYSGPISHISADAAEVTLDISGSVIPDPGINVTGELSSFSHSVGNPSASQSYTLSGSNLSDGIAITLPEGYEISFSGDVWLPSLTLAPLEGNVEEITLFIRLNALTEGTYNGNIVHSSTGVDDVSVAVSGTASESALSAPEEIQLSFYPNPATEKVMFNRNDLSGEGRVSLYTMEGSLINKYFFRAGSTELEIDVNSLQSGIYLIEYKGANDIFKQKFIKK